MARPAPFYPINGPRPRAPRFGLLPSALVLPGDSPGLSPENSNNSRVFNGVEVWAYPSDIPDAFDTCAGESSPPNVKSDGELPDNPSFPGYTLNVPVTCTARSLHDQAQYSDRAMAALEAGRGWQIERQLWTGDLFPTTQPFLADSHADVLWGGNPTNPANGLAILEKAVAASGRFGWIHATWDIVSTWSAQYQIFQDGPVLRTILGTIVVPGAGYDGSGPAGEDTPDASQAWAYATGPVEVRLDQPYLVPAQLKEAITFSPVSDNSITYRAEQNAVAYWDDTLHAAVLIDRCQTDCDAS